MSTAPRHSFELMRAAEQSCGDSLVGARRPRAQARRCMEATRCSAARARLGACASTIGWAKTAARSTELYWHGEWERAAWDARARRRGRAGSDALIVIDAHMLRAPAWTLEAETRWTDALDGLGRSSRARARRRATRRSAFPALATRARRPLSRPANESDAGAAGRRALSRDGARAHVSAAGPWVVELARVLEGLGRGDGASRRQRGQVRLRTGWLERQPRRSQAATPVARRQTSTSASGRTPDAARHASARRGAADRRRASRAGGRRRSSGSRSSSSAPRGAERYVREAEALLAVS